LLQERSNLEVDHLRSCRRQNEIWQ